MTKQEKLFNLIEKKCRLLLSEQNRNPYSPDYGCFDRRYWAWKLIDFPEATFQRNVYSLALYLKYLKETDSSKRNIIVNSIIAGLKYTLKIQHKNGSFDQTFPYEQSFGATAFLLHPLLESFKTVKEFVSDELKERIENSIKKSADFLISNNEKHATITNHLAGAVLSLLTASDYFNSSLYEEKANILLEKIIKSQSNEGWFQEYEGADPGYQTLCVYYLARINFLHKNQNLKTALEKSLEFLKWFIHPDGTYAGEYGSRRTAIYYPGGIALLQSEFSLSKSITSFMLNSIINGNTVTLEDIDIGNLAPLLSNYFLLYESIKNSNENAETSVQDLPCQHSYLIRNFNEAGLFIRNIGKYYSIIGNSNGSVLKIFDKKKKEIVLNDTGYIAQTNNNKLLTTQSMDLNNKCIISNNEIDIQTYFYSVKQSTPTPLQFVILRILNLTLMRNIKIGNLVKSFLVKLLISRNKREPILLKRKIQFDNEKVIIKDRLTAIKEIKLKTLEFCSPYVSIHMASANYFQSFKETDFKPKKLDVDFFNTNGYIDHETILYNI